MNDLTTIQLAKKVQDVFKVIMNEYTRLVLEILIKKGEMRSTDLFKEWNKLSEKNYQHDKGSFTYHLKKIRNFKLIKKKIKNDLIVYTVTAGGKRIWNIIEIINDMEFEKIEN